MFWISRVGLGRTEIGVQAISSRILRISCKKHLDAAVLRMFYESSDLISARLLGRTYCRCTRRCFEGYCMCQQSKSKAAPIIASKYGTTATTELLQTWSHYKTGNYAEFARGSLVYQSLGLLFQLKPNNRTAFSFPLHKHPSSKGTD